MSLSINYQSAVNQTHTAAVNMALLSAPAGFHVLSIGRLWLHRRWTVVTWRPRDAGNDVIDGGVELVVLTLAAEARLLLADARFLLRLLLH